MQLFAPAFAESKHFQPKFKKDIFTSIKVHYSKVFPLSNIVIEYHFIHMQNSKKQSSTAYAKLCKQRKDDHLSSTAPNFHSKQNDKKENLYDVLMQQLEQADSNYIEKLCKKNEDKNKKKARQTHKIVNKILNDGTNFSGRVKKSNRGSHKSIDDEPTITEKNLNFRKKIKDVVDFTPHISSPMKSKSKNDQNQMTKQQKKNTNISLTMISKESMYFLRGLDSYIDILEEQPSPDAQYPRKERSYRKTIDVSEKYHRKTEKYVNIEQYEDILDKLKQVLQEKNQMQEQISQKNQQIRQFCHVLEGMHNEIINLKDKLRQQRLQKSRYSNIVDEFTHKIQKAKSRSKEKHYIEQMARNTHIPSSRYGHGRYSSLNGNNWEEFMREQSYKILGQCQREQSTQLRKKGGKHRLKKSLFRQQEDDLTQEKASIYQEYSQW